MRGTSRIRKGESISKPASWLRATALNILRERSHIERNSSLIRDQLKAEITDAPLPSDDEEVELIEIAHKALNLLRREDALAAEIVRLKVIKSLTWKQVKDFLEEDGQDSLSVSAVRKRGIRAIERMREIYNSLSSEDIESTDSNPIQSEFIFESPSDAINDIVIYQRELQKYNQEDFPEQWAKAQYDLAAACFELPQGERSENLEQAISASQSALQVYTREAFSEDWAKTQYLLGNAYFERSIGDRSSNIESAIECYEAVLSVWTQGGNPREWAIATRDLGKAFFCKIQGERSWNIERSIRLCLQAWRVLTQKDFPRDWAENQLTLGYAYLERIREDRAENIELSIQAYQRAIEVFTHEKNPREWSEIQYGLGYAYCQRIRGNHNINLEEAIAACQAALQVYTREIFPEEWAKTQVLLAQAYFQRTRGDRSENLNCAILSYQKALDINTDLLEAWTGKGDALVELKRYEEAISSYDWALALAPDSAEAFNSKGIVLVELGRYEEAIASYNNALELQPSFSRALDNRGVALAKLEQHEEAIASYEQALQLEPNVAETWNQKGQSLKNLERFEEALNDFNRAIELKLYFAFAIANRGEIYRLMGRYEEALRDFTHAFELDSNNIWTVAQRGQTLAGMSRYEEARQDYEHALVITRERGDRGNEAIYLRNLGNTYQEPTEIQQAIECFQRSLEISREIGDVQNQATTLSSLGNVYASIEQYSRAIDDCQQALSLCKAIGDRHNESLVLVDLADVYQTLINNKQSVDVTYDQAIAADLYEQALGIAQELDNKDLETSIRNKLVPALLKLEHSEGLERAIEVAQFISDKEKRLELLTVVVDEVRRLGGDRAEELLASIDYLPTPTENLQASTVRIYDENGAVVGSGFLITSNYLVTCAHVITQALGLPVDTRDAPIHPITLDFPFASLEQKMSAQVDFWSSVEDIAGLKLRNTFPENLQPIQLPVTSKKDLWRHSFKSFGFPRDYQNGVWISGSLMGKTSQGWLQLDTDDSGYSFEPGFSGAPILDEVLGDVVGMLVAVERRREGVKAAFAIPSSLLSRVLNHLHTSSVNAVVISPDNQFILIGNSDGTVRLQNFRGISIGFPFQGHQGAIWSVVISPDGQLIASGSEDGTIRLWNLKGQLLEQPFRGHEGAVYSVAFSPDGQLLVSGGSDATLRLWDLRGNLNIQPFQGHTGIISSVAFSPSGQVIASASDDKTIRLWDLQGRLTSVIQGHTSWVNSVTFSPDGQLIASGSDDRTVRLWDLHGNPVGYPLEGHMGSVSSVVFSSDAARIASGSVDQTIRIWDRHGHPVAQPLTGHTDAVKAVAFSPDGETIVSGGRDQSIRLWDLPTLLEQQVLEPIPEQLFLVYELLMSVSTDTVSVGTELEVTINLNSLDSSKNVSTYLLEVPRNKAFGSELNILLNASGLKLESDNTASLPLDIDEIQFSSLSQTQTACFRLTALRPGSTTITAEIYQGDTFETTLETIIQVTGLEEATFLDTNIKTEPRPVSHPDLVLQVQTRWNETASACTFRYHLKSFRTAPFLRSGILYQSRLLSSSWLQQVYNLLQTELETLSTALPVNGRSHLTSLGQYLFQHLLPPDLQADLCNLNRYQALTLQILADQDAQFPWPLLHTGREFLAERFIIGNWLWVLNNTQPYEFPVGAVNLAHYSTVEHPEVWATLLEPPGAPSPLVLADGVLDDPVSIEAMRGLHLLRLGQSDTDASRQDFPIPLDEAIEEQSLDQKVRPIKLNLRRNRPLVTLSFLRNGEPELTDLSQTWASTFLRAGCSAFVGPLWTVNSTTEAAFISSFYHALWTGDSLGGAFHTARRLARATNPESMDWLAYCLFGDPMARPYCPVPGQGYAVVEPVGQDIADPIVPGSTVRFRVSLRRTPPVWHDERVIEVAEDLSFNDLQAHIAVSGLQVTPATSIELQLTPSGNYLGWFNLTVPADVSTESALVQVYFADGMQTIHTLSFPLTFQAAGGDA